MKARPWTAEDVKYLEHKWGEDSIPQIAEHLGRTVNAVKLKAYKLELGPVLMDGNCVTFNYLASVLTGCSHAYTYQMTSWVENRGLPVQNKRVNDCTFRVVYLHKFWKWAEKNRSFINFSKLKPLALGEEPDWVAQQRKIDAAAFPAQRKDRWTPQEDQRLKELLNRHKYTWAEISREMGRSNGAIQRRCCDLGLRERPVSEYKRNPWKDSDLQQMADMIRKGYSYAMIGEACGGRSEKAVRGVVFSKYRTENMDKVRAMLGDGPWGAGAPKPVKREKG